MFQRLEDVEKRYEELNVLISDPEVISRQNEWKNYMKEHSDIEEIVFKYREYKTTKKNLEDAKELVDLIEDKYPDVEVELNYGGQPIYYYIVSAE